MQSNIIRHRTDRHAEFKLCDYAPPSTPQGPESALFNVSLTQHTAAGTGSHSRCSFTFFKTIFITQQEPFSWILTKDYSCSPDHTVMYACIQPELINMKITGVSFTWQLDSSWKKLFIDNKTSVRSIRKALFMLQSRVNKSHYLKETFWENASMTSLQAFVLGQISSVFTHDFLFLWVSFAGVNLRACHAPLMWCQHEGWDYVWTHCSSDQAQQLFSFQLCVGFMVINP